MLFFEAYVPCTIVFMAFSLSSNFVSFGFYGVSHGFSSGFYDFSHD